MKFRIPAVVAVIAMFAVAARAQLPPYPTDVLKASASISGTVVRAADEAAARRGLAVTTQLHARICALLSVTTAAPQSVAWFTDAAAWKKYIGNSGAHIKGRGVSALGSVAVLVDEADEDEPLAHELVHQVLKSTCRAPVPLWFEEGAATCFGWMAAKELTWTMEQRRVVRTLPEMQQKDLIGTRQLLESRDYPATDAENFAFYRQAEELVRVLHERLGPEKFRALTVELEKSHDLRAVLAEKFSINEGGWADVTSSMRARAMMVQRR